MKYKKSNPIIIFDKNLFKINASLKNKIQKLETLINPNIIA